MKKITTAFSGLSVLIALALLDSCHQKTDSDQLKKDVLTLHDQVMNEDGKAMSDKMALDSIDKKMPMPGDSAKILSAELDKLSTSMMDWMHKFDPEKNRTEDENAAYFAGQKTELLKLDSNYNTLRKAAEGYLKKCGVKSGAKMKSMKM